MLKAQSTKHKAFFRTFGLPDFRSFLPFTFYLLPLTALQTSCRFNPDLQGKGQAYLQGTWQQGSSPDNGKLLTLSKYQIKFDCDSFFLKADYRSRTDYGSDSCRRNGQWAEYIKGAYSQKNDTLFLKGQYCNANFSLKTNTDCFHTGTYEDQFKIDPIKDSVVQLAGATMVLPVQLHLTKRTTCTQKSL